MLHSQIDHSHAAFFEFREATKDLRELPEAAQIRVLHYQLLQALQRATDFQDRSRGLERQIDSLRAETTARCREHQEFAAQATRELIAAKAQGEEQLRAAHREALATENAFLSLKSRHDALTDLCHSLLQTIERAASRDAAEEQPASPSP